MTLSLEDRFWTKVDTDGPIMHGMDSQCWVWTASRAGGVSSGRGKYGTITVCRRKVYAHRLGYELQTGRSIPSGILIDHTCANKLCVRASHLRPATSKQNQEHRTGAQSNSASGVRGVSWFRRTNRWRAQVRHNGQTIHVGYFDTASEAECAVTAKRNELFTHNDFDRQGVA